TELRDDIISSQYALYWIIPVIQFFDTARMSIASQCVDAGFILSGLTSMVQNISNAPVETEKTARYQ
ncbi:hypothetical protein V3G70_26505, partial [Escherichia coli]|uniref:hypothetical protein n=1 Tax=Escherichia coli TaxID=562 RepID=UPI003593A0B7